jgi:hypothetical protein
VRAVNVYDLIARAVKRIGWAAMALAAAAADLRAAASRGAPVGPTARVVEGEAGKAERLAADISSQQKTDSTLPADASATVGENRH